MCVAAAPPPGSSYLDAEVARALKPVASTENLNSENMRIRNTHVAGVRQLCSLSLSCQLGCPPGCSMYSLILNILM